MSYNPCKLNLLAFFDFLTDKYLYTSNILLIFINNKQHKQFIIVIYQKYEILFLDEFSKSQKGNKLKTIVKDEQIKRGKDYVVRISDS
jgi:hypothetical protein